MADDLCACHAPWKFLFKAFPAWELNCSENGVEGVRVPGCFQALQTEVHRAPLPAWQSWLWRGGRHSPGALPTESEAASQEAFGPEAEFHTAGKGLTRAGTICPARLIPACCPTQYREERFRLTSESTNQRVLWWSIAQTVILILTGIWQMRHLKSFFEAKKLV